MAQPNHAELLRNKMLAPVPPAAAVASPNHAEILLVNRYEKFRRHIYHGETPVSRHARARVPALPCVSVCV